VRHPNAEKQGKERAEIIELGKLGRSVLRPYMNLPSALLP
jgi:hypothetical protein